MDAIELIKQYTHHDNVKLSERGNTAIFAALYCVRKLNPNKKIILFPDEGGWFSYFKYPKMLELKPWEVFTDKGIIDMVDLKNKAKDALALIYSQPAGYYADQPIKEIYEICKENNCFVIMDITASLGTPYCDGKYADFTVASFGKWKPVNLQYGGSLTALKKEYFEIPKEIFNTTKFDETKLDQLAVNLAKLKERFELFEKHVEKIKSDLKDFKILHKDKWGINVIVAFENEDEKNKIISYCENNKYQFTICPRYIRVNQKAISIEVKRLE